MGNTSWKAFERRVAKRLGGKRRGADYRSETGGKDDVIHDALAPECKLYGPTRLNYQCMLDAARQAEANAEPHKTPIAIVKRKGDRDDDALVVMRFKTWVEWYGA